MCDERRPTGDGLCVTCERWSKAVPDDARWDRQELTRLPYKQRACLNVIDGAYGAYDTETTDPPTEADLTRLPDDAVFVNVYEAYPNLLMTGPKFGCIHWKKDTR